MNILLFPTRFFPAISGGDFYLQRLGKEFLKMNRGRDKDSHNKVLILSTNALDFGALHGKGRYIFEKQKYYGQFQNLSLLRFKIQKIDHKEYKKEERDLQRLCIEFLGLSNEISNILIKNGPILPLLNEKLLSGNIKEIIPFKPDVIHCSYLPYANLLYTLIISKVFKIPSIVTPFLHDSNLRYQNHNLFKILNKFDKIIACTNYEKKKYIENGIEAYKIKVLPMGVDMDKFQKDKRIHFLKNFSIHSPIILFCGHKNYEKGALSLIETLPLIYEELPNISAIFIGSSTKAFNYKLRTLKKNFPSLKIINLSPDNLSGVFDPIKIGAFQIADLFCMPSRSDAYGIAYLEAWACKKPVIAIRKNPMTEIINDDSDGLLVKFDDTNELKSAIIKLLNDPKKRELMGEKGFLKISINNNWSDIAAKTIEIYTKIGRTNEYE